MSEKISKREALAILVQVRRNIAERGGSYICCEISAESERQGHGHYNQDHPLRLRVMSSLEGHGSMEGWLHSKGLGLSASEARAVRVAFLDKWIDAIKRSDLP